MSQSNYYNDNEAGYIGVHGIVPFVPTRCP